MFEMWRLRDEIRFLFRKLFRIKRWKSLIFGVEIGFWMVAIYFILWSVEIGVRTKERRIG